jgi:dTMP kinase
MAQGKLIVLEGLDGSGISTQTEYLRTWCQKNGIDVAVTKEPTDGPAGGIIKWVLRHDLKGIPEDSLALLFAADRLHHLAVEIAPALRAGTTVISDRYSLSSFAYQSVNVPDLDWLRAINSKAPAPDLTIFLDVAPKACLKRMSSDAWRGLDKLQLYERLDMLEATYNNFQTIIPILRSEGQNIVIVDGSQDINNVHSEVISAARKILKNGRATKRAASDSESRQIAALLDPSAAQSG